MPSGCWHPCIEGYSGKNWIPAYTGMTKVVKSREFGIYG